MIFEARESLVITLVCLGGRLPVLRTDDGQTHLTFLVNVRVINFCLEGDFWWFEGVLSGEINSDAESTFVVRGILLGMVNNRTSLWVMGSARSRTYRDYESIPLQDIRFIHYNIPEYLLT